MNRQEYEAAIEENPWRATELEYHPLSRHQPEYWRGRPRHFDNPTKPVLKARLFFSKVNYDKSYGTKGKKICNGVLMPAPCSITQENMKGQRFARLTTRERRLQRTLKRVDARISLWDSLDRGLEALKRWAESITKANEASIT